MDKVKHFVVCALLSFFSTEAALAAAVTKEYVDSEVYGNHWCWLDFLADAAGIAVGTVARVLIAKRWNWF